MSIDLTHDWLKPRVESGKSPLSDESNDGIDQPFPLPIG